MLDRIKLRNLLNIAQEQLAIDTNLTSVRDGASLVWRERLGYKKDSAARLATAYELLNWHGLQLPKRTQRFRNSSEGMRLVTEVSEIRVQGNRVAHQTPPALLIYSGALTRADSEGMMAIAEFVCV